MTERIYVTYSLAFGIPGVSVTPEVHIPIYNPGTGTYVGNFTLPSLGTSQINLGYHQTLNYINSNGTHFVAEAYPSETIDNTVGRLNATFLEEVWLFGETNTDSQFGAIVAESGEAKPGHFGRPEETVITGDDLSGQWEAIERAGRDIAGNYEYRPLSQNSNTFVAHALEKAGLPPATGTADTGETFNIPGADEGFTNRISSVSDVAEQLGIQSILDMFENDPDLLLDSQAVETLYVDFPNGMATRIYVEAQAQSGSGNGITSGVGYDFRFDSQVYSEQTDGTYSLNSGYTDTSIIGGGIDDLGNIFTITAGEIGEALPQAAQFGITEDQIVKGRIDGGSDLNGPETAFNFFSDEFALPFTTDNLNTASSLVHEDGFLFEYLEEDFNGSIPLLHLENANTLDIAINTNGSSAFKDGLYSDYGALGSGLDGLDYFSSDFDFGPITTNNLPTVQVHEYFPYEGFEPFQGGSPLGSSGNGYGASFLPSAWYTQYTSGGVANSSGYVPVSLSPPSTSSYSTYNPAFDYGSTAGEFSELESTYQWQQQFSNSLNATVQFISDSLSSYFDNLNNALSTISDSINSNITSNIY